MFKEKSTEKLIEYIQSLPYQEQKVIIRRISEANPVAKSRKAKPIKKSKLSGLKGRVTKISAAGIDRKIKSLRAEWK